MRALIVDDVDLVRLNLRHQLQRLEPEIEIAESDSLSGLLSHASGAPVNLILMDLKMPGMKGPSSIADVRVAFPGAVIVVVSGHADHKSVAAVREAGADAYISKATRGAELRDSLRKFCNLSASDHSNK